MLLWHPGAMAGHDPLLPKLSSACLTYNAIHDNGPTLKRRGVTPPV